MFHHAGKKIRIWAILAFALCVCASIFGGAYYILNAYALRLGISFIQIAIGCGIVIGGIFVSYLVTLFVVAFGELVESTTCNMEINKQILEKLEKKEKEEAAAVRTYQAPAQPVAAAPVQPAAPAPVQPAAPAPVQPVVEQVVEPVAEPPVAAVVSPEYWFCTACGTKNGAEATTCSNCGKEKV